MNKMINKDDVKLLFACMQGTSEGIETNFTKLLQALASKYGLQLALEKMLELQEILGDGELRIAKNF
jgi:hypothetical protein